MKAKSNFSSPLLSFSKRYSQSISFTEPDYILSLLDANESLLKEMGKLKEEMEGLKMKLKKYKIVVKGCAECKEKINFKNEEIIIFKSESSSNLPLNKLSKSKSSDSPSVFSYPNLNIPKQKFDFQGAEDYSDVYNLDNNNNNDEEKQKIKYGDYARSIYKNYKASSEKVYKKKNKVPQKDVQSITLSSYNSISNDSAGSSKSKLRNILKREKSRILSSNEETNTRKELQFLKYSIVNETSQITDFEFDEIIKKKFEKAPDDELPMANQNSLVRKDVGKIYNWGDFFILNEQEIMSNCQKLLKNEKIANHQSNHSLFAVDDEIGDSAIFVACGVNTTVILTEQGITIKTHNSLSAPVCIGIPNYPPLKENHFIIHTKYILGRKIIKVACGAFHFAAITSSNEVIMWGENRISNSQSMLMGQISEENSSISLPKLAMGISGTVIDIACGMHHTVAVSSFGVYSQGSNIFGQLGREGDENQFELVPGLYDDEGDPFVITSVACGMYHTVALTKCKRLFTWGKNQGLVMEQDFDYIFRNPKLITQFREITNVACGFSHTVILSSDGMFSCGSTLFGKLGIGYTKKETSYFEKVRIPAEDIDHLSCGPHTSFAIKKNGEVFVWGFLSNVTKTDHQYIPRLMIEISNRNLFIKKVAAGANHACFLSDKKIASCFHLYLKACQISDQLFSIRRLKGCLPHNVSLLKHLQDRVMERLKIADPQIPIITVDKAHICYTFSSSGENKTVQYITITNTSNQDIEVISYIPRHEEQNLKYTHTGVHPNSFLLPKNSSSTVRINLRQDIQKEVKFFFCFQLNNVFQKDVVKAIKYFIFVHLIPFFGSIDEEKKLLFKNTERSKDALILSQLASHVPQEILFRLCRGIPNEPTVCTLKSAVLILDISGFTSLTYELSKSGKSGGERITEHLNSYFSTLISVVNKHGGDIAKFVGDALICLFANEPNYIDNPDSLDILLLRAVNCALKIQDNYAEYKRDGLKLTLHIAVGAGELSSMIVGGINKTWHYFVSGPAISSLNSALKCSTGGEVIVSGDSFHLIERYCEAEKIESDWKVSNVSVIPELRGLPPFYLPPGTELASRSIIPYFVQNAYERGTTVDELRRATVMFIKLTNIEYTNDPVENCRIVNEFVVIIQKEIFKQEGTIIQFFEDEKGTLILASFGLPPLSHEDDAIRAINAAIGVYSSLNIININSAIGVTTGDLFCGLVGSKTRKEYTIISNSVNVASRLMGVISNIGGGILCDQATRDACYPRLQFEALEPVFVKGTSDPIAIYRPDASTIRTPAYLRDLSPSILGRKKILSKIKMNLRELVRGKSSWVTVITGAEGMGKSSTVNYAIQVAKEFGITTTVGESDPIQRSNPFYIWKNIITKILDINFNNNNNNNNNNNELSREKINELSLKLECEEKFLPLFNNLLSINLQSNEDSNNLQPLARNSLILRVLTRLIEKRSNKEPLLIVLENLHWVDSLSLSLATNIAKIEAPILLLVTTRPIQETEEEKFHNFYSVSNIRHIHLHALSLKQCAKLTINLFNANEEIILPQEILSIISISKGNPFFIIALLLGFRDSKLIDVDPVGNWIISSDLKLTEIPSTIESAINSRLDCLSAGTQSILKIASAIGKDFEVKVLEQLTNDREEIVSKLNSLTSLDILFQRKKGVYSFKNETVLKMVYSRLLFSQRKKLHEKLALYYESLPSFSNVNLLAHHWDQVIRASKVPSHDVICKTIKYMKLAGENARNLSGSEATYWFERSLELLNLPNVDVELLNIDNIYDINNDNDNNDLNFHNCNGKLNKNNDTNDNNNNNINGNNNNIHIENNDNHHNKMLKLQVMGMPMKGYSKFSQL